MKNLTWIPLLAGLALVAACGGDDDDDDDDDTAPDASVPTIDASESEFVPVTVNWPLTSGVDNTPGAPCPAGATTATVDFDSAAGPDYQLLFDCEAETGTDSATVTPGTYIVWVTLQDEAQTVTYAMSFEYDLTVAAGQSAEVDAPINVDSGYFALTWSFTPDTRSCETLGADGVSILATIADTKSALDTILNCSDGGGITDGVELADAGYVVQISLLDPDDNILGQSEPRDVDPFRWANELVDIGNFEFFVE
jgi:hypothetical protein